MPDAADTVALGLVIISHGQLATELLNAAEMIAGPLPHATAVSIGWHDNAETARQHIADAISRSPAPAGVIVMTDMFGGTPSNLAMTFLADRRVELVTGVNLPMLIKFANLRGERTNLRDVARTLAECGRAAIWVPADLVETRDGGRS